MKYCEGNYVKLSGSMIQGSALGSVWCISHIEIHQHLTMQGEVLGKWPICAITMNQNIFRNIAL